MTEMPWPPPMHADPSEYLPPRRLFSWTKCVRMRAPDMPLMNCKQSSVDMLSL